MINRHSYRITSPSHPFLSSHYLHQPQASSGGQVAKASFEEVMVVGGAEARGIHRSRWRGAPGDGLPGHGSREVDIGESAQAPPLPMAVKMCSGKGREGGICRLLWSPLLRPGTAMHAPGGEVAGVGAAQEGYIVLYVEDVAKFVEFYANGFG
ncbi:hypothetical protein Taro_030864 [Colocasia esculenta]|uniref:Uncharacterized protein n=1 Tax=Colocasia esculenta TaxID=4460 RepID=A0A843VV54_COLES|nr:hypothetical protein [Colocasia esculenta]